MVTSENPSHLLLVDDEDGFRTAIAEQLADQGFVVEQAGTGEAALERLADFAFDILITDLRLPGVDGRQLLADALARYPDIIAIVITGYGGVRDAVEVTRQGAEGFITKPFQFEELRHELSMAIERRRLRAENAYLRAQLRDRYSIDGMIGRTPVMVKLFELLETVAATTSTVLITGDTGTGKELAARALHDASPRRSQKFVAINCSAIPETLLEAAQQACRQLVGLALLADDHLQFVVELGEELGVPMWVCQTARLVYKHMMFQGMANQDVSTLFNVIEQGAGFQIPQTR